MTKKTAALLIGSCFALAACADQPADPTISAPSTRSSLDVSNEAVVPGTPYGADDAIPHAAPNGNSRAATGGFASGRFELGEPFFPIEAEQYSFTAVSTGWFPSAKGQLEGKITRATNYQDIHVEVDCMVVNGNEAWMSGPITRLKVNGVDQDPRGRQVAWRVRDNGEPPNSPPDMGTVMFVGFPQACLVYFFNEDLPLLPNARGNIQVSQK
jgi:hypothetical protein